MDKNSDKEMPFFNMVVFLSSGIVVLLCIVLAIYTFFYGNLVFSNSINLGMTEFFISAYLFSFVFFLSSNAWILHLFLTMFLSFVLAIYTWFFGGWTLSKDITLGTTAFSVLAILLFIFLWIVPNVMDNKKNLEKSENMSFLELIFFINFCIFLLGLGSGIYSYLTDGYDALMENDYFWGSFLFFGIAAYIHHVDDRRKQKSLELKQLAEYLDSPQGRRERLISTLTDISGVSDNIARTILDQFPTFKSIEKASVTDLSKVPRVGKNLARAIKARINNLKNT